jgi:hypothetical protein
MLWLANKFAGGFMGILGFDLNLWDYLTFIALFIIGAVFVGILVFLGGLPGRIAIARKHPDAEAVKIMGWAGFLAVVPWMQAFIWAFKPTDIVDIRRFPAEEKLSIDEEISRLKGDDASADKSTAAKSASTPKNK